MNKKSKKTKILLQISYFFVICIFTFAINILLSKSNITSNIHEEKSLSDNWECNVNGKYYGQIDFANERFPMFNKGDELSVTSTIPMGLPQHPVLKIYSIHSIVSVYIDDELIYQYGEEEYEKGKLVGFGYHYVPLEQSDAGKNILIDYNVTEDKSFSSVDPPLITMGNYVHRDFMVANKVKTGCILFLILFGVAVSLFALVYSFKDKGMLRLIFVGLFSISVGLWSLCTTNIICAFSYSLALKSVMEFASLYLAPTFLFAYFAQEIKAEGKVRWVIYNIILGEQVIFVVAGWVLQLSNFMHFPALLRYCHLIVIEMIVFLVIRFLIDTFKGKFHDDIIFLGFEFLVVFVFFDLLRYNIAKFVTSIGNDHYVSLIYLGVLIFVIAMIIDFGKKYLNGVYKKIENATLEKLAYTDYLTGLSNRRSIENLMDDIDAKGDDFVVIGYDLNDLKQVNDTLGHEEGDRYIKEFAGALLNIFKEVGLSGRNGGDEFVTILPHGKSLDIDIFMSKLEESIRQINQDNPKWNMSVAYGIAKAGEEGADNIRLAIKLADDRMYIRKKEMKKAR